MNDVEPDDDAFEDHHDDDERQHENVEAEERQHENDEARIDDNCALEDQHNDNSEQLDDTDSTSESTSPKRKQRTTSTTSQPTAPPALNTRDIQDKKFVYIKSTNDNIGIIDYYKKNEERCNAYLINQAGTENISVKFLPNVIRITCETSQTRDKLLTLNSLLDLAVQPSLPYQQTRAKEKRYIIFNVSKSINDSTIIKETQCTKIKRLRSEKQSSPVILTYSENYYPIEPRTKIGLCYYRLSEYEPGPLLSVSGLRTYVDALRRYQTVCPMRREPRIRDVRRGASPLRQLQRRPLCGLVWMSGLPSTSATDPDRQTVHIGFASPVDRRSSHVKVGTIDVCLGACAVGSGTDLDSWSRDMDKTDRNNY